MNMGYEQIEWSYGVFNFFLLRIRRQGILTLKGRPNQWLFYSTNKYYLNTDKISGVICFTETEEHLPTLFTLDYDYSY